MRNSERQPDAGGFVIGATEGLDYQKLRIIRREHNPFAVAKPDQFTGLKVSRHNFLADEKEVLESGPEGRVAKLEIGCQSREAATARQSRTSSGIPVSGSDRFGLGV
ncbi:hypothetical protein LBMAG46_32550 [Planctomycetia bacterium]|nr:hypothetical protein LBMAG46_32550 [Planctomycetia bacterium]